MSTSIPEATLRTVAGRASEVIDEVCNVFVGPREVPELLMIALLARGHALLEGVPGVAKTTLAKTFATTLGCEFRRIQFTPDLLPADITGTYVLAPKEGSFLLREGPVFANVVLGDEINRAPAKTQSALLEAMQEQQVTIEGETRSLPSPFLVLATQNPIEHAGTYPLPEAQIDRFLIRMLIEYPSAPDERGILRRFLSGSPTLHRILEPIEILQMQKHVQTIHVEDEVLDYAVRLTRSTRDQHQLFLGASPRASLALVQASQARALVKGRNFVLPDDIKILAAPVLAHRLVLTPEAEMAGARPETILQGLVDHVTHRRPSS